MLRRFTRASFMRECNSTTSSMSLIAGRSSLSTSRGGGSTLAGAQHQQRRSFASTTTILSSPANDSPPPTHDASTHARDAAAGATAATVSPFAAVKHCMVRSYKLDAVVEKTLHGVVLGKQENALTYSFVGFERLPFMEAAECILRVPEEHRTFHVICGRAAVACDFFGDIDLPITTSAQDIESMMLKAIQRITSEVNSATVRQTSSNKTSAATTAAAPEILLLANLQAVTKKSLHLHMRFPNVCFSDYRTVKHVAEKVNGELGASFFDLACYRERGMMRMAYSRKIGGAAALHFELQPVYTAATCPELTSLLAPSKQWSAAECVARSFVAREELLLVARSSDDSGAQTQSSSDASLPLALTVPSFHEGNRAADRRLAASRENAGEYDKQGRPIPAFFAERVKTRRYREVIKSVHALPSTAAEPYDQWIRVGLALHNFGSDDANFEEWIQFSVRAPHKFSRETCRAMWDKFQRHPDHENWPRGYNYLVKSIWRELGIVQVK